MSPLTDQPADPNIEPQRYSRFWFRFFEILPGGLVWLALLTPFLLAVYAPLAVTVFIILFDIYWFIRSTVYAAVLVKGYFRFRRNVKTDWAARLEQISALTSEERERWHIMPWDNLYHAIILPSFRESKVTLEKSLASLVACPYPKDRVFVVIAVEERDPNGLAVGNYIKEKFEKEFGLFLVTEHPDGIVGEVKAKGANATWAAKILREEVEKRKIPLENVLVSTADADTRFPEFYLNCLAYNYCVTPDRLRASFQPIATFFNNIWQAPMMSRILGFGTTFWQLSESIRDYRLITFSTHATSLATLVDIDYWCTSVVNEDSRQFFRSFFHYRGNFRVIPLFIPIYMDAVHVTSLPSTLHSLYLQQQRWAYGVEHFPYIVLESHRLRRAIPFTKRFAVSWRAFEGAFSWATASFFITVVGWLPILLNEHFRGQVAASNFPPVAQTLLSLTWVGLVIASAITLLILPPRPADHSPFKWLGMIVQWLLIPISAIFFGALPGIDAITRLMLGKYLGFRVTEKQAV